MERSVGAMLLVCVVASGTCAAADNQPRQLETAQEDSAAIPKRERGDVPQSRNVVAFGDSITQGYNLPVGAGWVELLAGLERKEHGADALVVLNAGAGGNTSAEGLRRLQTDVLAHTPALVLVEFGGNDAVLGPRAVSVEDFRKNLLAISESVRKQGGEVMFLTFPPVINEWHVAGKGPGYDRWGGLDQCVEQYRQQTRDVAKTLGSQLFDLDAFIRRLIAKDGRDRYILKDGVHLTVESNRLLADEMTKFIRRQVAGKQG